MGQVAQTPAPESKRVPVMNSREVSQGEASRAQQGTETGDQVNKNSNRSLRQVRATIQSIKHKNTTGNKLLSVRPGASFLSAREQ